MQISIMLNQQQNGPRQCNGTIGGNLQDSENEENVQELFVQTFSLKIQHPWLNLNNSQMQEEIKTCAWTNSNFQPLNLPPASHASLGNWRLKSNTWINKKVARVSIYLDIRCYGGKGSHTVYVTFLYWDESALYENIWEIRRNYKRYL